MVGGLRDVITCAEFQIEMLMGYDFTGGRIFDCPIDFSMGLTTVQRHALPVIKREKFKSKHKRKIANDDTQCYVLMPLLKNGL